MTLISSREKSVMPDVPEILISCLILTLSAKGTPALYLVIPIGTVLFAVAWRIAVGQSK
jgi:hypothetical protein